MPTSQRDRPPPHSARPVRSLVLAGRMLLAWLVTPFHRCGGTFRHDGLAAACLPL